MFDHRAAVGVGRVALAVVGRVALNDRAMQLIYHRRPEIGVQEVLVAHLAGMDLDGNLARQLDAQQAIKFYNLLRRNRAGKVHLGLVGHDWPLSLDKQSNTTSFNTTCGDCTLGVCHVEGLRFQIHAK